MSGREQRLRPSGFAAVDRGSVSQQALSIDMLEETTSWDTTQAIKAEIVRQMRIEAGDHVLDAGCGVGEDCLLFARLVGDAGQATGIDISETLIAEARNRANEAAVSVNYQTADILDLPFDDDSFDAAKAEQTFQWLDRPGDALKELIRVVRPGGRLVIADTDYGGVYSLIADPELGRRVLWSSVTRMIPQPLIARRLPVMFKNCGLDDIEVRPMFIGTNSQTTGLREEVVRDIVAFATESGQVTAAEAERWAKLAWESHARGTYWYGGLTLIVSGTTPG